MEGPDQDDQLLQQYKSASGGHLTLEIHEPRPDTETEEWAAKYGVRPLAAPGIRAGIKTSAVINLGTATLGALIGAGGYGQPILTGIRLDDTSLILQGAIPAAALALAVQGAFEIAERHFIPRGLRARGLTT